METESKLVNQSCSMDFQNLISCIECHKEDRNVEVIIESLKTIVNICANEDLGKNAFREVGGLDFLLQYLTETDQVLIVDYNLKVLAFVIDGNVHSQMHMTNPKVFGILLAIFDKKTYPLTTLKNALMLLSAISFQNRAAQDLIFQNGCLSILINLYKFYAPNASNYVASDNSDYLDVWMNISSALCFVVNNPLNEPNQVLCSKLFPVSLRIIETSSSLPIIEAASSFLSLTVANNEKTQNAFAEFDGFLILMHLLGKALDDLQSCMEQCNNFVRKETLQIISSLISIISASVLDHKENAVLCGQLGIVSLMIKLLSTGVLIPSISKNIILALSYCTDAWERNRLIILNTSDFDLLLKKNTDTNDPELISAAKCLLQICIKDFDYEDDIQYTANSSPFQNINEGYLNLVESRRENFALHSKNEWENTRSCDTLRDIFKTQDLLSYEKAEIGGACFNTKPEETKTKQRDYYSFIDENVRGQGIRKKKHTFSKNNVFSLGSNLESISENDSSLESAGHLYRKQQMKLLESCKKVREFEIKEGDFGNKSSSYCSSQFECNLSAHSENAFMKAKQKTLKKHNVSEIQDFGLRCYKESNSVNSPNQSNDQSVKRKLSTARHSNPFSVTDKESDIRFDSRFLKSPETRNLEITSCSRENIVEENISKCGSDDSNDCPKANSVDVFNVQIPPLSKNDTPLKNLDLENFGNKNKSDLNSYREKVQNSLSENFSSNSCELSNITSEFTPDLLSGEDATVQPAVTEKLVDGLHNFKLPSFSKPYSLTEIKDRKQKITENFSRNSSELSNITAEFTPDLLSDEDATVQTAVTVKLGDGLHNFKLPSFSKPYSLTEIKDRKQKRSKGVSSPNTTSCVEVIVLPGTPCCEHKLASQFELLKICRISEAHSSK